MSTFLGTSANCFDMALSAVDKHDATHARKRISVVSIGIGIVCMWRRTRICWPPITHNTLWRTMGILLPAALRLL